jgi:FtsH-binding integral membrane protein
MSADEKFAVSSIGCGIVSFLFFQFNRNAKLKKSLFIWFEVVLGLVFLTWFSMRIWQSFHSIPILVVFLLPAILILALIMLMNAKKTIICDSCGRTIHTGIQPLKNGCCPKCGFSIE